MKIINETPNTIMLEFTNDEIDYLRRLVEAERNRLMASAHDVAMTASVHNFFTEAV
jgi:hypothetical protein